MSNTANAAGSIGSAIIGGIFSNRAAGKQVKAAERANAFLARQAETGANILESNSSEAINQINQGTDISAQLISQGANDARAAIDAAFSNSTNAITTARDSAVGTLVRGGEIALKNVNKFLGRSIDAVQTGSSKARGAINSGASRSISEQRTARDASLADFQPFFDTGVNNLEGLESLITDPNAQKDFITNNPFFDALADDSENRLLNNQAAKGKVGSGGTTKALQDSLLLLGNDLLSQNISQRFGLVDIGLSAANSRAGVRTNSANAISNINQNAANARANSFTREGETIANLNTNAGNFIAQGALSIASDIAGIQNNTGNNLANLSTNHGANTANIISDSSNNLANLNSQAFNNKASIINDTGVNKANLLIGAAGNQADLITQAGNANAAGTVGVGNAVTGGINNFLLLQALNQQDATPKQPELPAGF